jgi:hypothetical protein
MFGRELEPAAFHAAFERVAARLVTAPYHYAGSGSGAQSIATLREKYRELPGSFDELIQRDLCEGSMALFITLLVLREMLPPVSRVRARDIYIQQERGKPPFTLFAGDLEVKGNFDYENTVLVLGDLIVDGLVEDRFEGSPLLVAGSVRARGMYIGSETRIGGSLRASELVHLRNTPGGKTLLVERGGRTKLFLWTQHDSKFIGTLEMRHQCSAYPSRDDANLVKLRAMLTAYLARKIDGDAPDLTHIARAVREGCPVWKSAPVSQRRTSTVR